jgi:hypothetical protein
MDLYILAKIGTLNSLNGSIPKDSSNPKLNHPTLSTTTNTTNGYTYSFFVDNTLYVGSNDAIKKEFKDSVCNHFDVKFLGPAKCFLQMRIHQHKDKSYTLDQHCYALNTLQPYNPNSEFSEHETPFPPDYTFSKDNQPVNDQDKHIIEDQHNAFPSALLCVRYSILSTTPVPKSSSLQFANLQKTASALVKPTFRALIWLIGYLQRRSYYAIKFYPDATSNPVYDVCRQHRIPQSNLTVFLDASWQDCPDTGHSTCRIYDLSQRCSH